MINPRHKTTAQEAPILHHNQAGAPVYTLTPADGAAKSVDSTAFLEDVLAPSCKIEMCPNKLETRPLWLSLPGRGRHVANDKKQAVNQFCRKMTESLLE